MKKRVLNVGQCALDHGNISDLLNKNFDAEIESAKTHDEAISLSKQNAYDLILVNRLYDSDGSAGLATIEQICGSGSKCPVILVSNYAEAQKAAEQAGAVTGFGKANLSAQETIETLRLYLDKEELSA